MTSIAPRFDRVAHIYRLMEYLSFGPMLERCRFFHLPSLARARRALIIGDGDGRFLARCLAAHRELHAVAIDASPAMLRLLISRAARVGASDRVTTFCADARTFAPPDGSSGYDLVVTHFFLDCLTPSEAAGLMARLRPSLAPRALWLVSEFQIPDSPVQAWLARRMISGLYAAFRLLTGLRVRQIPPWQQLLARAGFTRAASRTWLGGLLVSELWQYSQATAPNPSQSHQEMPEFDISSAGNFPGIDPGPEPKPGIPPDPKPEPAPGPPPEPDPIPYPGPLPAPQPVT